MNSITNISHNEAMARNDILVSEYKKLPSYCLWTEYDINNESISDRLQWWKTLSNDSADSNNTDTNTFTIMKWFIYLKSISNNATDEYCSKRNTCEFHCDI